MTVEYFTPSEEDIHTAKLWMNFYKMWGDYAKDNDDPHLHVTDGMTWLDFEHLFTEEQKEEQRRWLLVAPVLGEKEVTSEPKTVSVEFTAMMEYGKGPRYKRFAENVLRGIIRSNDSSLLDALTSNSSQALISETSLPSQPFPQTGTPKDFSQMPFVLKEPEAPKPTYSYRETRTVDDKDYYFYFQELPKDKK